MLLSVLHGMRSQRFIKRLRQKALERLHGLRVLVFVLGKGVLCLQHKAQPDVQEKGFIAPRLGVQVNRLLAQRGKKPHGFLTKRFAKPASLISRRDNQPVQGSDGLRLPPVAPCDAGTGDFPLFIGGENTSFLQFRPVRKIGFGEIPFRLCRGIKIADRMLDRKSVV